MTDTPPPPPPPSPAEGYPEASQATTALVLGIISIVVCGIAGPFAWSIGKKELEAIDSGRRPPGNRGSAQAGRILGIIGTALIGLGIVGIILFVLFASIATVSTS
jgi:hypothetical protein